MDAGLLCLHAVGITVVITRSSLFSPLRDHGPDIWRKFWVCPLCVGVWVGLFLSAANAWALSQVPAALEDWTRAVLGGLGTGALAGAIALVLAAAIDFFDDVGTAAEKIGNRGLGPIVKIAAAGQKFPPDEAPTDPNDYLRKTRKVPNALIAEAEAAIERKREGGDGP